MSQITYPRMRIRSKNDLSKQIAHKGFSRQQALALINDVQKNYHRYWRDNLAMSKPDDGKFVRTARGTKLGLLLQKIDRIILARYDVLVPKFIFGGRAGSSHVKAARNLIGSRRKRTLLKMDIKQFFEQNSEARVVDFFIKSGCSPKAARLIAGFCCVPAGAKGQVGGAKTLARGFATSSRLAAWCNVEIFNALLEEMQQRLGGNDVAMSIYVDDIGVTASDVSGKQMVDAMIAARGVLLHHDAGQPLLINDEKTQIQSHVNGLQILGIALGRNSLRVGNKTQRKLHKLRHLMKKVSGEDREVLRRKYSALRAYKRYVERS